MYNSSIIKRMGKIEYFLKNLEFIGDVSRKEFVSNIMRWGSAERFLQLAIEALIDIGNHIIAEKDWGIINESRDVAYILFEKGVLDEPSRELFLKMIGFRNILVHEYMEVDVNTVFDITKNKLNDIRKILSALSNII